jgi:hypothetical protein
MLKEMNIILRIILTLCILAVSMFIIIFILKSKKELFTVALSMSDSDIVQELDPLKTILYLYENLNIPIILADDNKICAPWGSYQNSKYQNNDNQCLLLNSYRQCFSSLDNKTLVQCSNLYSNNLIENANQVQVNNLYETARSRMKEVSSDLDKLAQDKENEIQEKIIKKLEITKILNQQNQLITNNSIGLDDKKNQLQNNDNELDDQTIETEIKLANYSNFKDELSKLENKNNIYKKIIFWISIILVITVILIFFTSKLL